MKKVTQEDKRALIFAWDDPNPPGARLLVACVLTFGGLAGLFILFRVVTPESRPVTTRPQQMMVLNAAVPAERALIHQAMDRSFPLLPTEPAALARVPAAAVVPKFKPAVSTFALRLKPLTPGMNTATKPRLFALDMDLLPPLPKPPPAATRGPAPQVLRLVVEGGLARRLASGTDLPGIALAEPARPEFRVAVGRMGQVLMALPVTAAENAQVMAQLQEAVAALRFHPDLGKNLEWGQVRFRWEGAPQP